MIAKLDAAGKNLLYFTYTGIAGPDSLVALKVTGAGDIYAAGTYGCGAPACHPFVLAINAAGSAVYAKGIGGSNASLLLSRRGA